MAEDGECEGLWLRAYRAYRNKIVAQYLQKAVILHTVRVQAGFMRISGFRDIQDFGIHWFRRGGY